MNLSYLFSIFSENYRIKQTSEGLILSKLFRNGDRLEVAILFGDSDFNELENIIAGIRMNEIEEIVNPFEYKINQKFRKDLNTISLSYRILKPNEDLELYDVKLISKAVNEVIGILNEYHSIVAVEKLYNSESNKNNPLYLSIRPVGRNMRGIAAAILVESDEINQTIDYHKNIISSDPVSKLFDIEGFGDFINSLW